MKHISRWLTFLLFSILICSCTTTNWSYEADAINLHITGDAALNLYQKRPHTLIVCAYHLKDLNTFNQLMDEKGGLEKLLECTRFDSSATYAKRLVIQPKQDFKESMSRTENAKYVGIVAGYYSALKKESAARSYAIPVSWLNNPKTLYVDLKMGPEGIQERKEN